jgi:transglutaminase-like putative cysteine protease
MSVPLKCMLPLVACWLATGPFAFGEQSALVVIGATGSASIADELGSAARTIHDGLVLRGFDPGAIEIVSEKGPDDRGLRDEILRRLQKRRALAASDDFLLVLLGFSGRSASGEPSFQVRGPRLTASALREALDPIPARQYVFVGTSDSGGFIAPLMAANRTVLAATREEGEVDLPRFPEAWALALKENPGAPWNLVAAKAASLTLEAAKAANVSEGEHARLGDPATGRILEAPFGVDSLAAAAAPDDKAGPMALLDASDIKVDIRNPGSEWERHEATDATRALIMEARQAPNPDGFSAVILEQRLGYKLTGDRRAEDFVMRRILLAKEDGVGRWANFLLPQDPPAVSTALVVARIIQPDGTSTVFNPAKLPQASDSTAGADSALTSVFLPDAHAGCLVEIAYRTSRFSDDGQPAFSEELAVQQDVPVLKTELQLQLPEKTSAHYKLRNTYQRPVEALANGNRVITWTIPGLAAFEALPGDPPKRDLLVALDVSSLDSWDAFATWYRRLTKGSDTRGPEVKAKAGELAEGATGRVARIRRAFEFVSSLRYIAIEFGISGIRPRTPEEVLRNRYGDCKDKANLLVALLAEMGIEAQFCLLNRGSSTDVDFAGWQFNHAIAFVPAAPGDGQPDDLWLDTTDSTAPFPTLSPGDFGRQALVFGPEAARFKTVENRGELTTEVTEEWNLAEASPGAWSGTLRRHWTGTEEYGLRASVRGLSPRQRDFVLQSVLERELGGSDFLDLDLTAADDLARPLELSARVLSRSRPRPVAGAAIGASVAPPTRNRPLLLGDGQRLHLIQTLEVTGADGSPGALGAFEQTAVGVKARCTWEQVSPGVWRRTSELVVSQPRVATSDYTAVRLVIQAWRQYQAQ